MVFRTILSSTSVSNIENQHIIMISEGSCDPEDCSDDAENSAWLSMLIIFQNISDFLNLNYSKLLSHQLSFTDIEVHKILLADSLQMCVVNLELLEVSLQAVSNLSDRSLEK